MGRPKKVIRKRERVFNKISNAIDYLQDSWMNVFKIVFTVGLVLFALYLALVWMPTVERVIFEVRYL